MIDPTDKQGYDMVVYALDDMKWLDKKSGTACNAHKLDDLAKKLTEGRDTFYSRDSSSSSSSSAFSNERARRVVAPKDTCTITVVADSRFYNHMGEISATVSMVVNGVDFMNTQ